MSKVAKQILVDFSPFENHNSPSKKSISNVVNNNLNIYLTQDTIFQIISSDENNKLQYHLAIMLTKKYFNISNTSQDLLKFIIFCKNTINNINTNYIGYDFNYQKYISNDIYKLLTRKVILDMIINEIINSDKLRIIILSSLSKIFKTDDEYNLKLKKIIIQKIIKKCMSNNDILKQINLVNIEKSLAPLIKINDEKYLIKYFYFEYYINNNSNSKFVNYDLIIHNFSYIFDGSNFQIMKFLKTNFYNIFINLIKRSFNDVNYLSNSFIITFGYVIDFIKQFLKDKLETFMSQCCKLINKKFIKYCVFTISNTILVSTNIEAFKKVFNTIQTIMKFYTIYDKEEIKNSDDPDDLFLEFRDEYCKSLVERFLLSKDFNINNEEEYLTYIKNIINDAKLDLTLNDIRSSILCNINIKKINIILKKENKNFNKDKLSCLYQTDFTCYNSSISKSEVYNDELQLYLKLAKKSFQESIYKHKIIVNISDVQGFYDYNVMFFGRKLRIISNLREMNILSTIKGYSFTDIEYISSKVNIDKYDCQKTIIKLLYSGIIVSSNDKYKLNSDFSKEEINLFNYDFNIIIKKVKQVEEPKEKTDIEKILLAQIFIVKEVKPKSTKKLKAVEVYNNVKDKISKYALIDESIFIKAVSALYNKDMLKLSSKEPIKIVTDDIKKIIKEYYENDKLHLQYEV